MRPRQSIPLSGTPIGQALRERPARLALASATAAVLVVLDMAFAWHRESLRSLLPLAALLIFGLLTRGDADSLGLRLRPLQGFGYWAKAAAMIGVAVGAFSLIVGATIYFMRWNVPVPTLHPADAAAVFLYGCVYAPLVEEGIYRFAMCTPAAVVLRPWGAVVLSGVVFAALHFVYHNPGPDNFIAGFFLGWAYLRSGTILVPVVLHALGNVCAFSFQLAAWHWLGA